MNYYIASHSDVGIQKETNQDSCCAYIAETQKGKILFAVMCDGMGGLSKGEVASATLIRVFSEWFKSELPTLLSMQDPIEEIKYSWDRMIKVQNQNIAEYGKIHHLQLGSTITLFLCLEDGKYLIGHVGDSRAYKITEDKLEILTTDQTVVANEIRLGKLTPEQAKTDPRRNVLLQCVGASRIVEPDYINGEVKPNECYMLCSDGFRHVITEAEIHEAFKPSKNNDEATMKANIVELIELNKFRHENDNITSILIKTM